MNWGERFRKAIAAFRQEPERSLASFEKAPSAPPQVTINYVEKLVVIQAGGDVNTDNSTNYGTRIEGNVNILGPVQNAFNTINNIDTSSAEAKSLQSLLKALHEETTKLIKALPDDEAERAARNLRNLTEAATAKKPDRKWFEVSAEGLLDAAKAVASLTSPVTTAVKAVLAFFKDSLPGGGLAP